MQDTHPARTGNAGGFAMLPVAVLYRVDLSAEARLLYAHFAYLAFRKGSAGVACSVEDIAAALGCSSCTTARKVVRELVAADLLRVRRRGQGQPNSYLLLPPRTTDSDVLERQVPGVPMEVQDVRDRQGPPPTPREEVSVEGQEGLFPVEDVAEEEPPAEKPKAGPRRVDGRPITDDERDVAAAVLAEFNRIAATRYSSADFVAKIVLRIREHPDLSVEDHGRVIARAFQTPWWRDVPSPSVVYGNAALFERSLHQLAAGAPPPTTQGRGVTAAEVLDYQVHWGPGIREFDEYRAMRHRGELPASPRPAISL